MVKNLPAVQETWVPSCGSGRSFGEENGNQFQYSCLGNPRDEEPPVHGVTKSRTQLSTDVAWNEKVFLGRAAAAAAAAKLLQSWPTLCDPIDGSPPGSPSLGFSRQEHWSGLTFPFPMHENEKWKWSRSVVSDSVAPWTAPTRLLRPWDFPCKSTGVGRHCLPPR